MNANPIYIEYYSHEECDCYKIDIPWTSYAKSTVVLCPVSDGTARARLIAVGVINQKLADAIRGDINIKEQEEPEPVGADGTPIRDIKAAHERGEIIWVEGHGDQWRAVRSSISLNFELPPEAYSLTCPRKP